RHFVARPRRAIPHRAVGFLPPGGNRRRNLDADDVRHRRLSRRLRHHLGRGAGPRGGRVMDHAVAALAGLFLTAAIYLLLSRSLIRMLLGLALLGNGINLVILVSGRLSRAVPPIAAEAS